MSTEWTPHFREQEIWIFNTYYHLFGENCANAHYLMSWRGRLDELAKCLGASTGQIIKLIFADAVINIEGPNLWLWMRFLGQTAPSEQMMMKLLMPNIDAAARGEGRTWTLRQAKENFHGPLGWGPDSPGLPPKPGQPTPGIFVWRQEWGKNGKEAPVSEARDTPGNETEKSADQAVANDSTREEAWERNMHSGIAASIKHFLEQIDRRSTGDDATIKTPNPRSFGVLLEYSGANLRFLASQPLIPTGGFSPHGIDHLPDVCVTMLGGPKGISAGVISVIRESFKEHGLPLLEVALGEQQQMAHVCMGYLRVEDQNGRYKSSLTDLLRLGKDGYKEFMEAVDAALPSCATAVGQKRRRVE